MTVPYGAASERNKALKKQGYTSDQINKTAKEFEQSYNKAGKNAYVDAKTGQATSQQQAKQEYERKEEIRKNPIKEHAVKEQAEQERLARMRDQHGLTKGQLEVIKRAPGMNVSPEEIRRYRIESEKDIKNYFDMKARHALKIMQDREIKKFVEKTKTTGMTTRAGYVSDAKTHQQLEREKKLLQPTRENNYSGETENQKQIRQEKERLEKEMIETAKQEKAEKEIDQRLQKIKELQDQYYQLGTSNTITLPGGIPIGISKTEFQKLQQKGIAPGNTRIPIHLELWKYKTIGKIKEALRLPPTEKEKKLNEIEKELQKLIREDLNQYGQQLDDRKKKEIADLEQRLLPVFQTGDKTLLGKLNKIIHLDQTLAKTSTIPYNISQWAINDLGKKIKRAADLDTQRITNEEWEKDEELSLLGPDGEFSPNVQKNIDYQTQLREKELTRIRETTEKTINTKAREILELAYQLENKALNDQQRLEIAKRITNKQDEYNAVIDKYNKTRLNHLELLKDEAPTQKQKDRIQEEINKAKQKGEANIVQKKIQEMNLLERISYGTKPVDLEIIPDKTTGKYKLQIPRRALNINPKGIARFTYDIASEPINLLAAGAALQVMDSAARTKGESIEHMVGRFLERPIQTSLELKTMETMMKPLNKMKKTEKTTWDKLGIEQIEPSKATLEQRIKKDMLQTPWQGKGRISLNQVIKIRNTADIIRDIQKRGGFLSKEFIKELQKEDTQKMIQISQELYNEAMENIKKEQRKTPTKQIDYRTQKQRYMDWLEKDLETLFKSTSETATPTKKTIENIDKYKKQIQAELTRTGGFMQATAREGTIETLRRLDELIEKSKNKQETTRREIKELYELQQELRTKQQAEIYDHLRKTVTQELNKVEDAINKKQTEWHQETVNQNKIKRQKQQIRLEADPELAEIQAEMETTKPTISQSISKLRESMQKRREGLKQQIKTIESEMKTQPKRLNQQEKGQILSEIRNLEKQLDYTKNNPLYKWEDYIKKTYEELKEGNRHDRARATEIMTNYNKITLKAKKIGDKIKALKERYMIDKNSKTHKEYTQKIKQSLTNQKKNIQKEIQTINKDIKSLTGLKENLPREGSKLRKGQKIWEMITDKQKQTITTEPELARYNMNIQDLIRTTEEAIASDKVMQRFYELEPNRAKKIEITKITKPKAKQKIEAVNKYVKNLNELEQSLIKQRRTLKKMITPKDIANKIGEIENGIKEQKSKIIKNQEWAAKRYHDPEYTVDIEILKGKNQGNWKSIEYSKEMINQLKEGITTGNLETKLQKQLTNSLIKQIDQMKKRVKETKELLPEYMEKSLNQGIKRQEAQLKLLKYIEKNPELIKVLELSVKGNQLTQPRTGLILTSLEQLKNIEIQRPTKTRIKPRQARYKVQTPETKTIDKYNLDATRLGKEIIQKYPELNWEYNQPKTGKIKGRASLTMEPLITKQDLTQMQTDITNIAQDVKLKAKTKLTDIQKNLQNMYLKLETYKNNKASTKQQMNTYLKQALQEQQKGGYRLGLQNTIDLTPSKITGRAIANDLITQTQTTPFITLTGEVNETTPESTLEEITTQQVEEIQNQITNINETIQQIQEANPAQEAEFLEREAILNTTRDNLIQKAEQEVTRIDIEKEEIENEIYALQKKLQEAIQKEKQLRAQGKTTQVLETQRLQNIYKTRIKTKAQQIQNITRIGATAMEKAMESQAYVPKERIKHIEKTQEEIKLIEQMEQAQKELQRLRIIQQEELKQQIEQELIQKEQQELALTQILRQQMIDQYKQRYGIANQQIWDYYSRRPEIREYITNWEEYPTPTLLPPPRRPTASGLPRRTDKTYKRKPRTQPKRTHKRKLRRFQDPWYRLTGKPKYSWDWNLLLKEKYGSGYL